MNVAALVGRRLLLRPLTLQDFPRWQNVRNNNAEWLCKWEPLRAHNAPDVVNDRNAFSMRCDARKREWDTGVGYGFGLFVQDEFIGEINLSGVQRGPFQSCYVGYWVAEACAGRGYMPEAMVMIMRFAFDQLLLHRLQVSIVPRNVASRRVMRKLDFRHEGVAERYLEIDGVWEDHIRYAMTAEEWDTMRDNLVSRWL